MLTLAINGASTRPFSMRRDPGGEVTQLIQTCSLTVASVDYSRREGIILRSASPTRLQISVSEKSRPCFWSLAIRSPWPPTDHGLSTFLVCTLSNKPVWINTNEGFLAENERFPTELGWRPRPQISNETVNGAMGKFIIPTLQNSVSFLTEAPAKTEQKRSLVQDLGTFYLHWWVNVISALKYMPKHAVWSISVSEVLGAQLDLSVF